MAKSIVFFPKLKEKEENKSEVDLFRKNNYKVDNYDEYIKLFNDKSSIAQTSPFKKFDFTIAYNNFYFINGILYNKVDKNLIYDHILNKSLNKDSLEQINNLINIINLNIQNKYSDVKFLRINNFRI